MSINCTLFHVDNINRKISDGLELSSSSILNQPKFNIKKEVKFREEENFNPNFFYPNTNLNNLNVSSQIIIPKWVCNDKLNNSKVNMSQANNGQIDSDENDNNEVIKKKEDDNSEQSEYNTGRWTNDEHIKFIQGILKYGNEWKRVQSIIKTRSSTQARSHAQKYFLKIKKEVNPLLLADKDKLIQYIITSNRIQENCTLTEEQKERLFSVIKANLRSEDLIYNENIINESTLNNNRGEEMKFDLNEEYEHLAYDKEKINTTKINKITEKRKITFCSRKRKSTNELNKSNEKQIFNIEKIMKRRISSDIPYRQSFPDNYNPKKYNNRCVNEQNYNNNNCNNEPNIQQGFNIYQGINVQQGTNIPQGIPLLCPNSIININNYFPYNYMGQINNGNNNFMNNDIYNGNVKKRKNFDNNSFEIFENQNFFPNSNTNNDIASDPFAINFENYSLNDNKDKFLCANRQNKENDSDFTALDGCNYIY